MSALSKCTIVAAAVLMLATASFGAALPADIQAKVEANLATLKALSTYAKIVSAVKAYNAKGSSVPQPRNHAFDDSEFVAVSAKAGEHAFPLHETAEAL